MSAIKFVRLLLQHNVFDFCVKTQQLVVLQDILNRTLVMDESSKSNQLICDFDLGATTLYFKARHLTGWIVQDTPFDLKGPQNAQDGVLGPS
jgi:hypothetical protein